MPTFQISVTNDDFRSINQHDCPDAEAARKMALRGALHIGVEQVVGGKEFFGAEISIEHDRKSVGRFMISIGSSSLLTA
jgi:hypothetical protein